MSVKKRKGSSFYWYDFTVKGRRFRGSTETDRIEVAKSLEAQLRTDILLGKTSGKDLTIDEICGKYLVEHALHLKSVTDIDRSLETIKKYFKGSTLFGDITNDDVADFKTWRLSHTRKRKVAGGKSKDVPISHATINRDLEVLRKLFYLSSKKWKLRSPDLDFSIHMMKEPEPRTRWINEEQAQTLIEKAATHIKPIIEFALLTGLRFSNIINLDWNQVNMQSRELEFKIKSNIPGGKIHTLPITERLYNLFLELEPKKEGFVFKYKGKQIKSIKTSFNKACLKADIKDFRFHDLRHTAATWMLRNNVPIDVVQEVLGHTQITTTKKYAHRVLDDKRKALDALSASQLRHNDSQVALYPIENKEKKA